MVTASAQNPSRAAQQLQTLLCKNALQVAPRILGAKLIHDSPQGRTAGRIVEVEAYNQDDPASHSFRPMSTRTAPMFGPAGGIYIYFIYGMHYCLNIVTGAEGRGEALLIRALEPLEGLELMQRRRGTTNLKQLCSGPAKLVQAMGIPVSLSGGSFFDGPLLLELSPALPPNTVAISPRIGISKAIDNPWRFYIKDSPFVSKHTS